MKKLLRGIRLMRSFENGWAQSIAKGFNLWRRRRVYLHPSKSALATPPEYGA